MKLLPKNLRAFTLIELLVVIGVLTVLLAIVLIAINPARQFSQANNTQRRSDVNAILNAVHQFAADNKGALPFGITTTESELCTPVITCATVPPLILITNALDICTDLVPTYIAALPTDPQSGTPFVDCGSDYDTEYSIVTSGSGRITVTSLTPELSETIAVTR